MTPPIVKVPPEELELTLGMELANAAVAAGVEHVVFSGLENVEACTGGTKWAPHFTDRAKVKDYIRSLPVRSSFVYLAFYYTNFLEYYVPQRGADGITFAIYLPPHIPMPFCDPLTAAGPAVREIFDHPTQYAGKTLPVIGMRGCGSDFAKVQCDRPCDLWPLKAKPGSIRRCLQGTRSADVVSALLSRRS